jgi:hypothetical protein
MSPRLSLPPILFACILVSESDRDLVVSFPDFSQAFHTSRPEWTCTGALLKTPRGKTGRVDQTPFMWVDAAWESDVTIVPIEPDEGTNTITLRVRVTPDTLRRWGTVGINPFLEACAQLQEYWAYPKPREQNTLTWL